jgi:ferric-dicitrate binding protein FerR (iron transport regulator)
MREDEPGWFYIGNGQLRYKDSVDWTERYQDIDEVAAARPMNSGSPGPAEAAPRPAMREPRRRRSAVATAVCAGLLFLGVVAGQQHTDVLHGWASWVTTQAGQFSATVFPPAPRPQPIRSTRK